MITLDNYVPQYLHLATAHDGLNETLVGVFHTDAGARAAAEAWLRNRRLDEVSVAEVEIDRAYLLDSAPRSVKRYKLETKLVECA